MDPTQFASFMQALEARASVSYIHPETEAAAARMDAWCKSTAAMCAQNISFSDPTVRMDTATGLFTEQLQHVMAENIDQEYPGLMAVTGQIFPMASGIPRGAETVMQRGYSVTGQPTLLAGEAQDIHRVSLQGQEEATRIIGLAVKWAMTLQQSDAAAMAGVPLDSMGMAAANELMNREFDRLLTLGDATYNIIGFANQVTKIWAAAGAGVEIATVGVPAAFVATWNTVATAANIMNDFSIMMARFRGGNVHEPTDCLMGSQTWSRLESLLAVAAGSESTVLEALKRRYPLITFRPWWRLDTAGAAGGERVILFANKKRVAEGIVTVMPENLQPVWTGVGFETVVYGRVGGIKATDTTGILYADM